MSCGDTVSELFLLLSGTAEIISPDPAASARHAATVGPQGDGRAQAQTAAEATEGYQSGGDELWGQSFAASSDASWAASGIPGLDMAADVHLNPNSPISMDLAGMRRPVQASGVGTAGAWEPAWGRVVGGALTVGI